MNNKQRTQKSSLVTRNTLELINPSGNLYKTVSVISKRAQQIATLTKEELNTKLADFASSVDNLEEVHENREQIEISKYYERLPKPTTTATDEFLDGKLIFDIPEEEQN
jgi:DNA-directed RNA polymerase subunit K/omega